MRAREDLLPALGRLPRSAPSANSCARKIYYISGGLANVGAIARIRVTADEFARPRSKLRDRLGDRESCLC